MCYLLGFSDYRHQSVDFRRRPQRCTISLEHAKTPSTAFVAARALKQRTPCHHPLASSTAAEWSSVLSRRRSLRAWFDAGCPVLPCRPGLTSRAERDRGSGQRLGRELSQLDNEIAFYAIGPKRAFKFHLFDSGRSLPAGLSDGRHENLLIWIMAAMAQRITGRLAS